MSATTTTFTAEQSAALIAAVQNAKVYRSMGWSRDSALFNLKNYPENIREKAVEYIYDRETKQPATPSSTPARVETEPKPMGCFETIARAAIARGENRVLPIKVGEKKPAIEWKGSDLDVMTTEQWTGRAESWVADLANRFPDLNACVVAKPEEKIFIDCDTYREFIAGYEAFSGEKFPVTYTTSARENRVQIHFQQTDATRKLGNVGQFKSGDVDLSMRQRNLYVLAEGSRHPSGSTYVVVVDAPFAPMPDKMVAFVHHLLAGKPKVENGNTHIPTFRERVVYPRDANGLIPAGYRHNATLQELGDMHYRKDFVDDVGAREEALIAWREKNVVSPRSDAQDKKVRAMVESSMNWLPSPKLTLNQEPSKRAAAPTTPSQQPTAQSAAVETEDGPDVIVENGITYAVISHGNGFRRVALDTSEACARPTFPKWVMEGTSIYENLVKPAVEHSSKYAEFIFMPAVQAVMNYLSHKVVVELQPTNMNLFVGLISPYGQFFKSTSCKLAHDYIKAVGLLSEITKDTKNADGKIVITQAGSSEGFGLFMSALNAKTAIMFNDELGKLVSKAGIENSSFSSDLLAWYGSAPFGNRVKKKMDSFTFEGGSYTFGWLWCTTDRNFNHFWPKLAGISSGIQDRMFFLVSPEKARPLIPYRDPDLSGAKKTRELIERAVIQRKFKIDDPLFEEHKAGLNDPRSLDLLFKLALYFAIDLELTVVDDDCMERARALVDYRNQAAKFLEPIEAENQEGRLMKEILRELKQNGGRMSYRDLCRNMEYNRYGRLWGTAYGVLKNHGDIVEFWEQRTPGKRKTGMVGLVLHDPDE